MQIKGHTMSPEISDAARVEDRERISALLSRYPALTEAELQEIDIWFKRRASSLDLGILAGTPQISQQYQDYRAQHQDRFKPSDIGKAALFIGAVAAVVGSIVLMIP